MKIALNVLAAMLLIVFGMTLPVLAQPNSQINPDLLNGRWSAWWITHPQASLYNYEVLQFRKSIELDTVPESFWVHASADNRYRLFVNGQFVCHGPARGDFLNWFYESVDIAPYLKSGVNVIAAQVWNAGEYKPMAQISDKTGFILQGDSDAEAIVNTDESWLVTLNKGYNPLVYLDNDRRMNWQYYVAGVLDSVIAADVPWGWETVDYDDSAWTASRQLDHPFPPGHNYHHKWIMVPRTVPLLQLETQSFKRIARTVPQIDTQGFISKQKPVIIPANSSVQILFDNGALGHGYPELTVSGGEGAYIAIRYAESFFKPGGDKGHRDIVQDELVGVHDAFVPDGEQNRTFRPLWTRTFRWLRLEVRTGDQPLTLNNLCYESSQYPTHITADFNSSDPMLRKIWDASINTQKLSAQETFVSDMYWEQIQYIGDTKVQAMSYHFLTGDEILFRLALKQFDDSRKPCGLTQSRYPCNLVQFSPLYSLTWITMLYDYYMYGSDPEYVLQFLPGVREVLSWYERQELDNGLLPQLSHLDFVDWAFKPHQQEILEKTDSKISTVHSLYYVYTLQQARELFCRAGYVDEAQKMTEKIRNISDAVMTNCYDATKGLFRDTNNLDLFSQHTNVMAVLTRVLNDEQKSRSLMQRVITDKSLLQVDMYFQYYLGRALRQVGLRDHYLETITSWRQAIDNGMTTFGEAINEPRSECHAWSTSPAMEFLSTVCGIESTAPGFAGIEIRPHFNGLEQIQGSMCHPAGKIVIDLQQRKGRVSGFVETPTGIPAEFIWGKYTIRLDGGRQEINLK